MFPFRSEFHKSAYVCRNKLQSRRLLLDTADSNTRQHETERPGAFFVRHMPSASCAPFPTLRAFCILRASASCTPSAFCTLSAFCTPLDFPYFTSQRNTGSGAAKWQFFPDMRVERSGHPCIGECWEIVCIFHLGFYSQSLETPVDDGMQDSHIRKKLRRAKEEGREYSKSDEK